MSDSVPWDEELRVQAGGGGGSGGSGGGGQDGKRGREKEATGQSLKKGENINCERLCFCNILCDQFM